MVLLVSYGSFFGFETRNLDSWVLWDVESREYCTYTKERYIQMSCLLLMERMQCHGDYHHSLYIQPASQLCPDISYIHVPVTIISRI